MSVTDNHVTSRHVHSDIGYNVEDSSCLNVTGTCLFDMINGGFLTGLSVVGFFMSTFTLYCLIFHVKLPCRQNMFIMNVAVSDILLSVLGTIRGLGMMDKYYVGADENLRPNWWCKTYTLLGNALWMTTIPVLIPLTVDRSVAVISPLKYPIIMNSKTCAGMILLTWFPILLLFIYDCTTYLGGDNPIHYQDSYHRCIATNDRSWRKAVYIIIPFFCIVLLYTAMLFFVRKAGIDTKKLLIMSTAIVATGLLTNMPDQLLITFNLNMNHEMSDLMTITLFYMNSIFNPIIYFCSRRDPTSETSVIIRVGSKVLNETKMGHGMGRRFMRSMKIEHFMGMNTRS